MKEAKTAWSLPLNISDLIIFVFFSIANRLQWKLIDQLEKKKKIENGEGNYLVRSHPLLNSWDTPKF